MSKKVKSKNRGPRNTRYNSSPRLRREFELRTGITKGEVERLQRAFRYIKEQREVAQHMRNDSEGLSAMAISSQN